MSRYGIRYLVVSQISDEFIESQCLLLETNMEYIRSDIKHMPFYCVSSIV